MKSEADFLFQKCVFLLVSSVGRGIPEALIQRALKEMGTKAKSLKPGDIGPLSVKSSLRCNLSWAMTRPTG